MATNSSEKGTLYMVLALGDKDGAWDELGTVRAASDAQAKAKALAQYRPEGGTVVACPARSWKPEDKKPVLSFR